MLTARESLDSPTEIKFDPATRNSSFSYTEDDGKAHTVWFLDAVTAYNEIRAAQNYQPAGYALWRLGGEDPSLWNVFGAAQTGASSATRVTVPRDSPSTLICQRTSGVAPATNSPLESA